KGKAAWVTAGQSRDGFNHGCEAVAFVLKKAGDLPIADSLMGDGCQPLTIGSISHQPDHREFIPAVITCVYTERTQDGVDRAILARRVTRLRDAGANQGSVFPQRRALHAGAAEIRGLDEGDRRLNRKRLRDLRNLGGDGIGLRIARFILEQKQAEALLELSDAVGRRELAEGLEARPLG